MRRFGQVAFKRGRRAWLAGAAGWCLLGGAARARNGPLDAGPLVSPARTLRFGVLPIGGAFGSRSDWAPLLAELETYLGYPVTMFSASTYAALARAVADDAVDLALLSGKLALDAVERHDMCVVAQVIRGGATAYPAVLVTRTRGPRNTLQGLLEQPDSWRLARCERDSLTGFIIPQLELFFAHGMDMETRFASEVVGTHQEVALAVANGEADVGATSLADLQRFAQRFPREAGLLHVVWRSERLAFSSIAVRCGLGEPLRAAVQDFLDHYDAQASPAGHDFSGFVRAGNASLLPVARTVHAYARARVLQSEWINAQAQQRALARVDAEQASRLRRLRVN